MTNPNQCYTKIEQKIRDALTVRGEALDPIKESAWYFVMNFEDIRNGVPYARLMNYLRNDLPFSPSRFVDVPTRVVGDVQFRNGRAYFGGDGYIEITVREEDEKAITKAPVPMADPKPLFMLGHGHIDKLRPESQLANPIIYYQCDASEFGLFVPNGIPQSKINSKMLGAQTARSLANSSDSTVWFTYIAESYRDQSDGRRYRLVHDIVDPNQIMDAADRSEYFLYDPVFVDLHAGAKFYVGNAPISGVEPFEGWLEEVIFDPTGGPPGPRPPGGI